MEKQNSIIKKNTIISSCKYFVASALFVLLYSCTKPNLPESKNNQKDIQSTLLPSLLIDSSLSMNSWLVCNINDIGSIANWYIKAGKYNEAINLLLSAQDSLLKIENDTINPYLGTIYDNLWNVYNCTKNVELSIKYYQKSIDMARLDWNVRSLLFRLNNLSTTYLNKKQYDKAIPLLEEAYSLLENNPETLWKDSYITYLISLNLSNSYVWIWDFISAKKYFLNAKYIVEHNTFSFYEIWSILTSEADFAIYEKDYEKAFSLYEKSLDLYNKNWDFDWEEWVFQSMKNLAIFLKKYSLAYEYQAKEFEINKKITSKENEKGRAEIETKYWVLEKEREIEKQQAEIEIQKQKTKNMQIKLLLISILLAGAAWTWIILKRKNIIITEQKADLEQSNEEIKAINDELNEKNEIITEKNEIITKQNENMEASINNASAVQKAILSSNNCLYSHFPKSFVYMSQKDIVSWDFYFAWEAPDGRKILITSDCTGHGVPAALLTILWKTVLENWIKASKNPWELLDFISKYFKDQYSSESQMDAFLVKSVSNKESMDLSTVYFDPESKILYGATTSRPILILRNNKIITLSPSFHSVIWDTNLKNYETLEKQLEKGDQVFIFSDGMSDQFDGIDQNKLKMSWFRAFLLTLSHVPVEQRSAHLKKLYDNHMKKPDGTLCAQTDDMILASFEV